MDGQLLKWLYQRLIRDDSLGHTRGCTYSDGLICLIGLFAVHDNRSLRWAPRPATGRCGGEAADDDAGPATRNWFAAAKRGR